MAGVIHSLETFGTVDGPGIRFVVFFAGCPMRCLYCHNPDTWHMQGSSMTASEIIALAARNRAFYTTGGITATGGEPLVQLSFLTELFELAKSEGFHTCLDTSGVLYDGSADYDRLLSVTDLVMLDIKHMDPTVHKKLTGRDSAPVFAFAGKIKERRIPLRLRHVIVDGYTLDPLELSALGSYARSFPNLEKVELLAYHTMAKEKYARLGIPYPLGDTPQTTEEQMAQAYSYLGEF